MCELRGVLDLHVEAEVGQSLKEPLCHTFLVALDEVLIVEIVKFRLCSSGLRQQLACHGRNIHAYDLTELRRPDGVLCQKPISHVARVIDALR